MKGVWTWGEREIIYLSLHCHHQNDFCIKMGSDESHFNVSVGIDGQSHRTVSTNHNLADIYSRLTVQWGEEFRTQALARDWADRTPPPCRDGIFFPGVPTHLARIMHRIHMDWWRVMFVPTPCV